jgi:DNA-binding CsgD family transcriptional regulator
VGIYEWDGEKECHEVLEEHSIMPTPRKPRAARTPKAKTSDQIPAPHNYVYPPRDTEADRLVSTLMLAGEAIAETWKPEETQNADTPAPEHATPVENPKPLLFDDIDALQELVEMVEKWRSADPRRAELLTRLREAFEDGDILRVMFYTLFPEQKRMGRRNQDGKPVLSKREVNVLKEVASDCPYDDIAQRLHIAPRTVNRHMENIYEKLGVKRPMQAVARAIAMGYLDMDTFGFIRAAAKSGEQNFGVFHTLMSSGIITQASPEAERLQSLAKCGLLLLTLSKTTTYVFEENDHQQSLHPTGRVIAINARGEIVRSLEKLNRVYGVAIAPPVAREQGFTPGHLFISQSSMAKRGLNRNEILEFTSEGAVVATFCGGQEMGSRLANNCYPLFAPDGTLLLTTTSLLDALLEFRNGGQTVRRLADGCFLQVAIAENRIYATQCSSVGYVVKVLDLRGNLYIANSGNNTVRKFSPEGVDIGNLPIAGLDQPFGLAFSPLPIPPDDANASGVLSLEDCDPTAFPSITLEVYTLNGCLLETRSLSTGAGGNFTVANLPHRKLHLRFKGSKWLRKSIAVDLSDGDVSGLSVLLQCGDANDDNCIDVLDLDLLIQTFDICEGDPGYISGADFNCDNCADVLDLDILLRNFDRCGDS